MLNDSVAYFLQDVSEIPSIDAETTTAYLNSRTPPKLGPYIISEMYIGNKKTRMKEDNTIKQKNNNNNNNNHQQLPTLGFQAQQSSQAITTNINNNTHQLQFNNNNINNQLSFEAQQSSQAINNLLSINESNITIKRERIIRATGISYNPHIIHSRKSEKINAKATSH